MEIKKIKGTRDYIGQEAKQLDYVFSILSLTAESFGYDRVYAPTMEYTDLFKRAVGTETDVVNKEMYTFVDRKDRSISLRPEGTAQTVRLALENKMFDNNGKPSVYYIGPMFRYERPQKGRQREFIQFGAENFGKDSEYVDLETIMLAEAILKEFDITKYELQINNIGNSEDRDKYNSALKSFIEDRIDDFSEYAREKATSSNVLRVLDSKVDKDLELLKDAPKISDYINEESKERFAKIEALLKDNDINYVVNPALVRGLDYYNDLVFEFVSTDEEKLGSKATVISGGRYDRLVNQLDESINVPAVGLAIGIERLMLAAEEMLNSFDMSYCDYYIATAYDEKDKKDAALKIAKKLRADGFKVILDVEDKKISKKLEKAEKIGSIFAVIVGNEINEGKVTIKELMTQETEERKIEEF